MAKRRNLFYNLLALGVYGAIIFLKTYYAKFSFVGAYSLHRSYLWGTLGAALVLTALLSLCKHRLPLFLIFNFFISLLLVADIVYARYFSDVISISLLRQANLLANVQESVFKLFKPRDMAYFLDFGIFIPALFFTKRSPDARRRQNRCGSLALVLLILGMGFVYKGADSLQKRQPGLLKAFWDKQVIANNIGVLNFHALDSWRYTTKQLLRPNLKEKEATAAAAWFSEKAAASRYEPDHQGSMEGKNLIMVQLEAWQGFLLNLTINGQEVTPNFNQLSRSSLTFNNAYYQTAMGGTSDAEFLANTSLFPAKDATAYYEFAHNSFHSLPLAAKAKGYSTTVMHPFRPGFWNRPAMYKALGFDSYLHQGDFVQDEIFGMGLRDHSFYRQAVARMQAMEQPFYTFLISLSSHFPYTDPRVDLQGELDVGNLNGSLMGNFLQNAHYTDEAIGILVTELRQAGLWDNSIVVFYGDHGAIPPAENGQLARLLAQKDELDKREWQLAQKVVMVMHFPGEEFKGISDMAVGQIDLFPTLANLLGFDCPYGLGQDLLNTQAGFVCFRNGNWLSDQVIYWQEQEQVQVLDTGQPLPGEPYEESIIRAREKLRHSDLLLEYNLIAKWNQMNP